MNAEPRIIFGWIDLGGVRAPIYLEGIESAKLRPLGVKHFYRYDGVTADPQDTQRIPASSERTTNPR